MANLVFLTLIRNSSDRLRQEADTICLNRLYILYICYLLGSDTPPSAAYCILLLNILNDLKRRAMLPFVLCSLRLVIPCARISQDSTD